MTCVSAATLRGVPFPTYADVLRDLLTTRYRGGTISIQPHALTEVACGGQVESPRALAILALVKEITHPDVRDGFFA